MFKYAKETFFDTYKGMFLVNQLIYEDIKIILTHKLVNGTRGYLNSEWRLIGRVERGI